MTGPLVATHNPNLISIADSVPDLEKDGKIKTPYSERAVVLPSGRLRRGPGRVVPVIVRQEPVPQHGKTRDHGRP